MNNVSLRTRPAWDVDRWMRDFFGPARDHAGVDWGVNGFTPAADVVKEGDDAVIRLELAGVDIDNDVNVELDRNRLVIHGQRRDEHASGDAGKDAHYVREVRYGSFRRTFSLPAHVSGDAISASYDAGVLTVRVTGVYAGTQAQRIEITK